MATPVEVLVAPAEAALSVGEISVAMYQGHGELLEAVRTRFADRMPGGESGAKARLVYQDVEGDWLLLQPEAPWPIFLRTVRKLVISCRQ